MAEVYNLSKYVLEELRENRIDKNTVISLIQKLNEREDIAVIGMGLTYGNTENYHDFWELLREKRTEIERCPKQRVALTRSGEKEENFCKGVFFRGIEMFDPEAFSMTQEEASALHPAHRMMLQAAYRALEDSGYLGEKNSENQTGVFIGATLGGSIAPFAPTPENQSSGIATKLAQVFDLRGGAYVIDAGGASSAIAIANACQAIRSKQCTAAVAGGLTFEMCPVKSQISPDSLFQHADTNLTRGFDNDPGGAYLAEGAAAVVLKPLAQAIADGDRIHGVICGHAINSNGANAAFTQSKPDAIETLVRNAVRNAQIDIEDVDYLEAEGYPEKTEQGLELSGLISGISQLTGKRQFCALGTLSGNIGHLQGAMGVFQLIKLCLAMEHKTLPPQYRFCEPTDAVQLVKSPFYVSDYAKPWPAEDGKPRQSGIYACGYGGNHLMLFVQEAPEAKKRTKGRKAEMFVLSAATKDAFRAHIEAMIAYLRDAKESLTDIAYTANVCRPSYSQYRIAVLCRSKEELARSLEEYLTKDKAPMNVFAGKGGENKRERISVDGFTMEELATAYSEGTDFIFDELFDGVEKASAELPPYPFDKQTCWPKEEPKKQKFPQIFRK